MVFKDIDFIEMFNLFHFKFFIDSMKKGEVSTAFRNCIISVKNTEHKCHTCLIKFGCAGKTIHQEEDGCVCNHDIVYIHESDNSGLSLVHFCSVDCFEIYCTSV